MRSTTTITAAEAATFRFHCNHHDGSRAYSMDDSDARSIACVYVHVTTADELIDIAEAILAAARDWEQHNGE